MDSAKKPDAPASLGSQILAGLVLLALAVGAWFLAVRILGGGDRRREDLPPAVRAPQTPEEEAIRAETDRLRMESARVWFNRLTPQRVGDAPREGASLYSVDNGCGEAMTLIFDGEEFFKVEIPARSRGEVELRPGTYDVFLVLADPRWEPGGFRLRFDGSHHSSYFLNLYQWSASKVEPCPGDHAPLRSVP